MLKLDMLILDDIPHRFTEPEFWFSFLGRQGCPPKGPRKLKFMEPIRVWYQVNTPGPPPQQFLCPFQKINSCFGTSQMAPDVPPTRCVTVGDRAFAVSAVEHSNSRFESIRLVKKSAFRFTSCHAVFLVYLLYSLSQKNKLTSLFAAFNTLDVFYLLEIV